MASTHSTPESRYLGRFRSLKGQTGESLKNIDSAGNLTEHLTGAKASLAAQEKNTKALFNTACELITGIDTMQQMLGQNLVKNMPLPPKEVSDNPSKQQGYVQLTMRFLQAGVVHFMEQMTDASDRIEALERHLAKLAEFDEDLDLLGEMQSLDLEQLEASVSKPAAAATPPPTPPRSESDITQPPKISPVNGAPSSPEAKPKTPVAKDTKAKPKPEQRKK